MLALILQGGNKELEVKLGASENEQELTTPKPRCCLNSPFWGIYLLCFSTAPSAMGFRLMTGGLMALVQWQCI